MPLHTEPSANNALCGLLGFYEETCDVWRPRAARSRWRAGLVVICTTGVMYLLLFWERCIMNQKGGAVGPCENHR